MANESVSPSDWFDEYSTLANAEAGVTVNVSTGLGRTRAILCLTDGTLIVKQGKDGTQKTLTMKAGVREDIVCIGIVASGSSGCVPIRVYR